MRATSIVLGVTRPVSILASFANEMPACADVSSSVRSRKRRRRRRCRPSGRRPRVEYGRVAPVLERICLQGVYRTAGWPCPAISCNDLSRTYEAIQDTARYASQTVPRQARDPAIRRSRGVAGGPRPPRFSARQFVPRGREHGGQARANGDGAGDTQVWVGPSNALLGQMRDASCGRRSATGVGRRDPRR